MEYSIKYIGNNRVMVNVPGDLNTLGKAEELKDTLEQLYQEGEREIIINIDNTRMINGDSIGNIVLFNKKLKEDGGCIYFTPPNDALKGIFEHLVLGKVFKVYVEKE